MQKLLRGLMHTCVLQQRERAVYFIPGMGLYRVLLDWKSLSQSEPQSLKQVLPIIIESIEYTIQYILE